MAAPTPVARGTPAGLKLKDGQFTKLTFNDLPTLSVWEKAVKPPGIDGGDPIPQTTHHNVYWRTTAPRALRTLTQSTIKVAYDPNMVNQLESQVNREQGLTVTFPDGSTLAFFGFLKSVEFDDLVEGEQPEATIQIEPTNWDPVNDVEAGPVLTSVAGT